MADSPPVSPKTKVPPADDEKPPFRWNRSAPKGFGERLASARAADAKLQFRDPWDGGVPLPSGESKFHEQDFRDLAKSGGSWERGSIPPPEYLQANIRKKEGLDCKDRSILMATFRIIRSQSVRNPVLAPIKDFMDNSMPEVLHTITEYDMLLPNIIYRISVPMTDDEFSKWQQVLQTFEFANAVNNSLLCGGNAFDQINEHLPSAMIFTPGKELTEILDELIKAYNLNLLYDLDKPWDEDRLAWKAPV